MIYQYSKISKVEIEYLDGISESLNENETKQYVYWKGFYDKVFFGDYFLEDWKGKNNPEFHKQIHKALDEFETLNFICPRGHGKTTTILIDILHSICYQVFGSQIYIAPAGLGEESLGKIRKELETNNLIKLIFGELVPTQDKKTKEEFGAKKWRMKQLELLNGETIETLTKGQSIRGKRPKRILVDDFDENKDVINKTIVEKHRTWFFSSLFNTLLPGGKIAILGTIVGNMCMVKYCRDIKKWETIEYKAINNGVALWADQWSLEDLKERKKKIGTALFNQEFMNIPLSVGDRIIKEYWIRYHEYLLEFDYIVMSVDPAISEKEKADFTGICVIGVKGENKYVLFSKGYKLSTNLLKKMVKVINARFKPNSIFVENVAYQDMLRQELALEGLPIIGIKPHKDKTTRLREVSGQIEFGNVYFERETQDNLIYQLTNFPDVEHDDELDALVYCLGNSKQDLGSNITVC